MKKLLNTLYITSPDSYLSLDGENIVVKNDGQEIGRVPLHNFESVVSLGVRGASPALMGACADQNISLTFFSPSGRFLARVTGPEHGNVVLRKKQYQVSENLRDGFPIAQSFIIGKIFNSRWEIERTIRDHEMQVDIQRLREVSFELKNQLQAARQADNMEQLRGIEGASAKLYFSVFNEMILQQKEVFRFTGRNRRPALDRTNSLLSFSYSLLASMCTSALEAVGLDPYVGFMHTDRPGRKSLALDLMEELRSVYADRFVLYLINNRLIHEKDFIEAENHAVLLTDEGRKLFYQEWQKKKQQELRHPFLDEKIEWGMVPYVQALLLSRYLRGDLDGYPPFFWK